MIHLEDLLERKLTRKQFLITLLTALPTALGITIFLGMLAKNEPTEPEPPGYGTQFYGP